MAFGRTRRSLDGSSFFEEVKAIVKEANKKLGRRVFMAWAQKTDRVSTGSNPCLSTRPYSKQRVQALASLLHTPDVVEAIADDMEVYVDIGISLSTPARLLKAIPCERGLRGVNSTLQAVRSMSLPSADHVLVLLGGLIVLLDTFDLSTFVLTPPLRNASTPPRRLH